MNRRKIFTFTLLFVCITGFSQTRNIDSLRQIWHDEIDFIAKSIQENSIDYLRGITQEDWLNGIQEIHEKVDKAKKNIEYYYALRYFGVLIKDAHAAFPDEGIYNRSGIFQKTDTIFPVWVKSWHDYRVFVVNDFSDKIPKYSEIISVNGIPANKIAFDQHKIMPMEDRIAMAYSSAVDIGDPAVWTSFANYLFCEGIKPPFIVEYKTYNDTVINHTTLMGIERQTLYQSYKKQYGKIAPKQGFAFLFSLGKNTVTYKKLTDDIGVLKISMFFGTSFPRYLFSKTDVCFYQRLAKCMKQIKKDGIKHLIIDLRDNKGGYEYDVYELLACFTDIKFSIIDLYKISDIERKWSAKFLEKRYKYIYGKNNTDVLRSVEIFNSLPIGSYFRSDTILSMLYTPRYSGEKFAGKTYLLTNGMSYSASICFAQLFQTHNIGLLVGETPGGYTAVTSGDAITVSLPFSKYMPLEIPIQLARTTIPEKYEYLTPDIPIEPTLEEWLYEKFNSLEILVNMIKENKIDKKL